MTLWVQGVNRLLIQGHCHNHEFDIDSWQGNKQMGMCSPELQDTTEKTCFLFFPFNLVFTFSTHPLTNSSLSHNN